VINWSGVTRKEINRKKNYQKIFIFKLPKNFLKKQGKSIKTLIKRIIYKKLVKNTNTKEYIHNTNTLQTLFIDLIIVANRWNALLLTIVVDCLVRC
jgi:hypothetical protein